MGEQRRTMPETVRASLRAALTWTRANKSFTAAAAFLLVAGIGWNSAMALLKWTMAKYPVPHPETVELEGHRLANFPEMIGDYELAGDGELVRDSKTGRPIFDGEKDGILDVSSDQLSELGMKKHKLNWYYFAIYGNRRLRENDARAHVYLQVTYYTGLLDAVPHVSQVCVAAAGGTVLSREGGLIPVSLPPDRVPPGWEKVELNRTVYVLKQRNKLAQYHIFSMNGQPTAHWWKVRGTLGWPSVKYCYFAKIQLAPKNPNLGNEVSDEICRDFAQAVLPEVLKFLPTAADVEKLEASPRR